MEKRLIHQFQKSIRKTYTVEDLVELRGSLPKQFSSVLGKKNFKYIATDISPVPEEYILHSFYKFISDFKPSDIEKILKQLDQINYVELKKDLILEMFKATPVVKGVYALEAALFDEVFKAGGYHKKVSYFESGTGIDDEIKAKGSHAKSKNSELPKLVGRWYA
ncbi:MAG: hypothetical protein OEM26_09160 [Saprospiraceae bacterium]|nr:hypothetical protein [Saprospiraceae bacterium]